MKEAKEAWDKHIKICTNAGGMNINGCVMKFASGHGNSMSGYKIGYATGDNIMITSRSCRRMAGPSPSDYDGNFNDILTRSITAMSTSAMRALRDAW
ncbi:MAG: hypothetical protein ACLS88_10285 [Faecalibacterium sp.]